MVKMVVYDSKKKVVNEEKARRNEFSPNKASTRGNGVKLACHSQEVDPVTIGDTLVLRHLWVKQAALLIQQVKRRGERDGVGGLPTG